LNPPLSVRAGVALPFLAAAFFYLIMPELAGIVRERVRGLLSTAKEMTPAAAKEMPPHLSPEYISDYLEYAVDAATVFPTLGLPAVGVVLALTKGMSTLGAGLLLGIGLPCGIGIGLKVIRSDPVSYVSRRYLRGRYTFLAAAGLLLNVFAGIIVAIFIQP
jgi:hypothetical protein